MILAPSGSGYVLQFTADIDGKVSLGSRVVTLQSLVEDGTASKAGALFRLALSSASRGKVHLDGSTVLVQFVQPPPTVAPPPP